MTGQRQDGALVAALRSARRQSPYFEKDLAKAAHATQMIGWGSPRSSTCAYAVAAGELANSGRYAAGEVVFVSAEGARAGRFDPIGTAGPRGAYRNLDIAIEAAAIFILDAPHDRARDYNLGERQVAAYLQEAGHVEIVPGLFVPMTAPVRMSPSPSPKRPSTACATPQCSRVTSGSIARQHSETSSSSDGTGRART